MQTLQLAWQPAAVLAAGLFTASAGARALPRGGARLAPYLRESGIIAALYSLWQLAGAVSLSDGGAESGLRRGRWIAGLQNDLKLPDEASLQHFVLARPVLAQACNWYYAAMHFTALGLLLLWLFSCHRDRYPRVRSVIVVLTASSLLIQFVPVAPPRLLPELGYVDVAQHYGQSVYGLAGLSVDQMSAMPSVHVGWALLVAWAVITVSTSRWRWWIVAHPAITVFVVAATGNHFWLDGVAAAGLLVLSVVLVSAARPLRRRTPAEPAAVREPDDEPAARAAR